MQIEEELKKIKQLTGTDSISDSLDFLHKEAIRRIEACKNEYSTIDLYKKYFLLMHPVGNIYFSTVSTNPGDIYGGKWEPYASGKILVCVDEADTDFTKAGMEGGEKMTFHSHTINNHMHNLTHTHDKFETHTHSYNHKHEVRASHAHTIEHQHVIPKHMHTALPHQHTMSQTSIGNGSIRIGKPMYGQLYHTTNVGAYWILSKEKEQLEVADTTTVNDIEQTKENKESLSSYSNTNVTGDAISTVYSNEELLYLYELTEEKQDAPIDKNGNLIKELEQEKLWSSACTIDGQSLDSTEMNTLQPYITCYMFKRIE